MFNFSYRKSYYLTHPWILARDVLFNLRWAWQRVYRGWDDTAAWSIDSWLCDCLPDMLLQLSKISSSVPTGIKSMLEWKKILLEMEMGFRARKELFEGEEISKAREIILSKQAKRGMELFVKYFDFLWD